MFLYIYRYLYTLCTCFHACVFPTVTVRYEKGTKSAAAPQRWGVRAGGRAGGRGSSNPRQHTASSRKKRHGCPDAAEAGVPTHLHKNGSPLQKPLRLAALSLSLEKLPKNATLFFPFVWGLFFFVVVVDLLKFFPDWPAVTTQCSTEERERERDK